MGEFHRSFKAIPLRDRASESHRMREKYPSRVCVLVDRTRDATAPDIDKHKFLVPDDLTLAQFIYVIRKRIRINPEKAIFVFVDGKLPPSTALMSEIYKDYHSSDGFLYVTYAGENTFG